MSDTAITTADADQIARGAARITEALNKTDKEKPTKEAQAELKQLLADVPDVWVIAGDVMGNTARKLISDLNATYAVRASLEVGWRQMQVDMAHPGDGALEKMLVQQVALCWLKLAYTERHHEHYLTTGSTTVTQADFWERRLSAAQRRYLRACETLARVRRLQLPAVQVNIAEKQVNQVVIGGDAT